MPILIQRKPNTNLTWEANALFKASFPAGENIFEIPNINYMTYLYKFFDLIEATDENGDAIDLTRIQNCCGQSIKLEVVKSYDRAITAATVEYIKSIADTINSSGVIKEDENVIDPSEEM